MKSLLDLYIQKPANYILRADGGFGKTTQMKYLQNKLLGQTILYNNRKCICIPIYIKMAEINRSLPHTSSDFLYKYLQKYFNYNVTLIAIKSMLMNDKYQFIFLLDGVNEVIHYIQAGIDVYDYLACNIMEILEEYADTVHFIITARKGFTIFASSELESYFYLLSMEQIPKDNINQYLAKSSYDPALNALLGNPMMLHMYKVIIKSSPEYKVTQRNQLIEDYFLLDKEQKKMSKLNDYMSKIRKKMIDTVLPVIAFHLELSYMQNIELSKLIFDNSINECIEKKYILSEEVPQIKELMDMTQIFDRERQEFLHQIFRDYFAAKGFIHKVCPSQNRFFTMALIESLRYIPENGPELSRRTQYLDLADFIYADVQENFLDYIQPPYIRNENEFLCFTQEFYQELAGVYDDLKGRVLSCEIAWISYDFLMKISLLNSFEKAMKLNFLFYCIINANISHELNGKPILPITLLEEAENCLYSITDDEKIEIPGNRFHELICCLLSNRGAYYTSVYVEKKDYKEALKWHLKALETRKQIDKRSVLQSYRTVFSDYFYLQQYDMSYQTYLEGLYYATKTKYISDIYQQNIPVDYVERGLGPAIHLLKDGTYQNKQYLIESIIAQIKYIYSKFCESSNTVRKDISNLINLRNKLEDLCEWDKEYGLDYNLKKIVLEYIDLVKVFV